VKMIAVTEEGQRLREQIAARMSEPPPPIAKLALQDQRELRDIMARALRS